PVNVSVLVMLNRIKIIFKTMQSHIFNEPSLKHGVSIFPPWIPWNNTFDSRLLPAARISPDPLKKAASTSLKVLWFLQKYLVTPYRQMLHGFLSKYSLGWILKPASHRLGPPQLQCQSSLDG